MAVSVKGRDLRVQTLTQVVYILCFDAIHTCAKPHSAFRLSLAVMFHFSSLLSDH